jgi:F-box and leucine-rich repeat protein 2/20
LRNFEIYNLLLQSNSEYKTIPSEVYFERHPRAIRAGCIPQPINFPTMANVESAVAGMQETPAALSGSVESEFGSPPETPTKSKGRHLLLRGIQRISSSPSLAQLGRSRSLSNPYSTRGSFSCVSLASTGTPSSPLSSGSFSPPPSPDAFAGNASGDSPYFDCIESRLAIRKVDNAAPASLSSTSPTSPLPPALVSSRQEAQLKAKHVQTRILDFWAEMPHEIKIHIFSHLEPKELVRASRVSKSFHKMCHDGQLWKRFDASEFYRDIPADSLAKIIVAAGPFIKDLNLRGCVQVEHYKRAEVVVKACRNLINATLEGCRNFQKHALHSLLRTNEKLAHLNLTGLTAVTNATCKIIAESCPQLEMFNVSWCARMDARGIQSVVEGCTRLKDLRAGEIKGFDSLEVSNALFTTNNLERLVLSGCADLNDRALKVMIHGVDPEIDILTDLPVVPTRKLRHLDLSRCSNVTSQGIKVLGHFVPQLEGLQISGCTAVTDAGLEPILATTPRLTHLELEDLAELTNSLLSEHLAKAPCASRLEHLSVSYCENLGDTGMLPVIKNCTRLKSIDLDNTRISDLVLAEAAYMVSNRSVRTKVANSPPEIGLNMVVYDCQNVTWTGIREVLFRNTLVKVGSGKGLAAGTVTYPTEVIGLKCFYGFQMTVNEHTKRVLRGDFSAATRLEKKWADYMQANEEAGATGAGVRRRRRRAREAQMLHADEEDGGNGGRRRARTVAACAVM